MEIRDILAFFYKILVKPIFFQLDAEIVHGFHIVFGKFLGQFEPTRNFASRLFNYKNKSLTQKIRSIIFTNPIGLSAGFDYNAQLTQILPSVGFGFETVGTITNMPYEGNPKPRLGRLPKSKSLLVNKGFKSDGADKVITNLENIKFSFPVGVSIGRTNSSSLKSLDQSIEDIIEAFTKFKKADLTNAYYEMNISCPNLIHGGKNITFYPPKNLEKLLKALDKLKLSKPLFIKMPINESDKDVIAMLDVIVKHKVHGVIFGNLQKDRTDIALNREEVKNAGTGNFSGKPCWRRSNELISLAFQKYGDKLIIIGCGGVFNAYDAYEKIKRGATLVMMITGMIYEGPQVIGQINQGLTQLLKEDGFKNISEAIGAYYK